MSTRPEQVLSPLPTLRDVHLLDQASAALQSLPQQSVGQVHCRVENNVAVVTGRVASFYHKQLLQERLRGCLGQGVQIRNEVCVQPEKTRRP